MFASLPHALNFFCKNSNPYYIAVAIMYLNMLQFIQSVQYRNRQNKYSSQTINVTFDGSCNKKISSFLLTLYIKYISFFK